MRRLEATHSGATQADPFGVPPALRANATVGDFIKEVKAKTDGDPKTIEGYCRSLRKIVADIVLRGGELLRNPSGPVSRLTRI